MKEDLLNTNDLNFLLQQDGDWCVSIFMPTHQVTNRAQEDQIRFKNLLREAENRLKAINAEGLKHALESAHTLLEDRSFWQFQQDGMALFMSKDVFKPYRLPIRVDEQVVVADRFHVNPLLPLLTGDGRFYLLALSQNEVRFFECTRYSISPIELEGVPLSLAEAMKYDEEEKQLQFHTRTAGTQGPRPAMFHGHGAGTDQYKEGILRFFQELDKGLAQAISEPRAPLVVAAVDYLFPIFKQAGTHPTIMEDMIPGNPDEISAEELHEQALRIVIPHFEKEIQENKDKYLELAGTGKTSNFAEEIVKAADDGRVDVLFVPLGTHQWGTYDPSTGEVVLKEQEDESGEDLLGSAAAQTLLNSGLVYAVKPDEMPDHQQIAAIFRY